MPHRVSLPFVSKQVEDLLMWRDAKKTGVIFGTVTLLYFLLDWSGLSLLYLLTFTSAVAVLTAFVWSAAGGLISRPGPPVPKLLQNGISEEEWRSISEGLRVRINQALAFAGLLATGRNGKLSLMVALGLYCVSYILYYFSALALLYTGFVLAFAGPKIYELKKDEIDQVAVKVEVKAKEVYKKVDEALLSKIPKAKDASKLQ